MVDRLNCPTEQKLELIDAAVKRIRQRENEGERVIEESDKASLTMEILRR